MFELVDGKPTIEAKALFIKEFKILWDRDRSQKKAKAIKELAYVYFMSDYRSEFNIYGVEKQTMISREVFERDDYEPDQKVIDAMVRYDTLQMTSSMVFLKRIRNTTYMSMKYIDELEQGKDGKIDSAGIQKLLKASKDFEEILETLEKWEKKVYGEEEDMKIRGGGRIGLFEDKEKATWIKSRN